MVRVIASKYCKRVPYYWLLSIQIDKYKNSFNGNGPIACIPPTYNLSIAFTHMAVGFVSVCLSV